MAEYFYKQHDTWPPIQGVLQDNGVAINLSAVDSVKFLMKAQQGVSSVVMGAATITNASGGIVAYTPATGDLATVGKYNIEWEIKWASGQYETVPNDGYDTLTVTADLGGVAP